MANSRDKSFSTERKWHRGPSSCSCFSRSSPPSPLPGQAGRATGTATTQQKQERKGNYSIHNVCTVTTARCPTSLTYEFKHLSKHHRQIVWECKRKVKQSQAQVYITPSFKSHSCSQLCFSSHFFAPDFLSPTTLPPTPPSCHPATGPKEGCQCLRSHYQFETTFTFTYIWSWDFYTLWVFIFKLAIFVRLL